MIFAGDVAIGKSFDFSKLEIPKDLGDQNWVINLEGSITKDPEKWLEKKVVFNDAERIQEFSGNVSLAGCMLANNHVLDLDNFQETTESLDKMNIPYVGAGRSIKDAEKPLIIEDNGYRVKILNFGWKNNSCPQASARKIGVNPYVKENVLTQVKYEITKSDYDKLVVSIHWNYELELYPQPLDRELAFMLIDLGADAVIGHHTHRVQGIEVYKGKPICYGLGNFLFTQNYFINGELKHPEFCAEGLTIEFNWRKDLIDLHWYNYDFKTNVLHYNGQESLNTSKRIKELTPFNGMSHNKYRDWFCKHRIQKKFLPVFYFDDSKFAYKLKSLFISARQYAISMLLKASLKSVTN